MKKNEKIPELEAFARAFDQPARGASSAVSRSHTLSSSAARVPGQTLSSQPRLRLPVSPAASWSPAPGQPLRPNTGPKRAQSWGTPGRDEGEDEADEVWEPWSAHKRAAPPPAPRDRFSSGLARLALLIVALIAAYSLQSHSRRHYVPGTISGATVSNISYDAGWPLTYAHVQARQAPLSDVDPTPAFHYINPALLAADVLALAVPLWLLLEAVWLFWVFVLERFGPRRLLRRLVAIGFTTLPAALWMAGALAAGIFLGFNDGQLAALPRYLLPVLAPAAPGFGLAAAVSLLLEVPPVLWQHDFGVFLLTLALPLAVLIMFLYMFFCLVGRAARAMVKSQSA